MIKARDLDCEYFFKQSEKDYKQEVLELTTLRYYKYNHIYTLHTSVNHA